MRTSLLFVIALLVTGLTSVHAQTIATFDTLSLPTTDTYYVNKTLPSLSDKGFNDGLAHFPYYYDTSFGGYWSSGFAYTNKTDSVHGDYTNQYSAKAAKGYAGSSKYVVVNQSGNTPNIINLRGAAIGQPVYGFYITNSTYAYTSMRNGDFVAKKFGGTTGNDPDWFKLTVKAYLHGTVNPDSVNFYLADFRPANNTLDSILNYWKWVNLLPLGNADSLQLVLTSSDTGAFGMNTPAFFCIDNFTTYETMGVGSVPATKIAKVYPNPAVNELTVQLSDESVTKMYISDLSGRMIAEYETRDKINKINTSQLAPGIYVLHLTGETEVGSVKFIKQ